MPSKHRHTEEAGDDGFNKIIRQVAEPAAVRSIRRLKKRYARYGRGSGEQELVKEARRTRFDYCTFDR
ncbi:MAG: hypothetical protein ACYTEQ_07450 [Planctomycetota bacterium]|jgi:hypothetical protein